MYVQLAVLVLYAVARCQGVVVLALFHPRRTSARCRVRPALQGSAGRRARGGDRGRGGAVTPGGPVGNRTPAAGVDATGGFTRALSDCPHGCWRWESANEALFSGRIRRGCRPLELPGGRKLLGSRRSERTDVELEDSRGTSGTLFPKLSGIRDQLGEESGVTGPWRLTHEGRHVLAEGSK